MCTFLFWATLMQRLDLDIMSTYKGHDETTPAYAESREKTQERTHRWGVTRKGTRIAMVDNKMIITNTCFPNRTTSTSPGEDTSNHPLKLILIKMS